MYRHRQVGTLTLAIFVVTTLATVTIVARLQRPALLLVTIPLAIVTLLFASLTIEVRDGELRSHFGPGFWRKRTPLGEIVDVEPTTSSWWEGWGIRITPRGMLYNVSGTGAVEVTLRSGKRFRYGTDEPARLVAAVRAAIDARAD